MRKNSKIIEVIVMTEKSNDIMLKCFMEVEKNHGRHALHRYQRLLENNANGLGRELSGPEIQDFKMKFEDELCRTVFTRQGK